MSPEALASLIQRVEEAKGPDRELDGALYEQLVGLEMYESIFEHSFIDGTDFVVRDYPGPPGPIYRKLPKYTGSIDAALALVERVKPGTAVEVRYWPRMAGGEQPNNRHAYAELLAVDADGYGIAGTRVRAPGTTIPLAICLALLRALQDTPHV